MTGFSDRTGIAVGSGAGAAVDVKRLAPRYVTLKAGDPSMTGPGAETSLPTVCHLIASGFAGGPEKQILELSRRLAERGQRVVVGSFRENRPSVEVIDRARDLGLPTFLIDTRSPFSPMAVAQLRRYLRELGVRVLVTHGYKPDLIGYLASRGTQTLTVPMVRGYTGEDWKVRSYEALDRRVLRLFPNVLTVSEGTKQLLRRLGLPEDRVHVVHNAVDSGIAVEPLDLRSEFDFPAACRVIVAAGRLSPEKGHRHLVDAMALLGADIDVRAVILGAGREESNLRDRIRSMRLEGRVVLAGFRTDVLRCIAGADAVVNPSLTEGLPNVVLEAMSVKTPVIATAVGGVPELIESGETGWLVDVFSEAALPSALAAAIGKALRDTSQAEQLADRARGRVERGFSFDAQADRFQGLCRAWLHRTSGVMT